MTEEERFEAWFQQKRRESWGNGYGHREGEPVPDNWSMGYRAWWREGWMARAADEADARTTDRESAVQEGKR